MYTEGIRDLGSIRCGVTWLIPTYLSVCIDTQVFRARRGSGISEDSLAIMNRYDARVVSLAC